jgi:hypothetical protein
LVEAAHFFALADNPPVLEPTRPAMSLIKVDLPQPLGPTTVTNSPSRDIEDIFQGA